MVVVKKRLNIMKTKGWDFAFQSNFFSWILYKRPRAPWFLVHGRWFPNKWKVFKTSDSFVKYVTNKPKVKDFDYFKN